MRRRPQVFEDFQLREPICRGDLTVFAADYDRFGQLQHRGRFLELLGPRLGRRALTMVYRGHWQRR